jgi:hypothetical protein
MGLIRQSNGKIKSFHPPLFFEGLLKLLDNGIECYVNDMDREMVVYWGSGASSGDVMDVQVEGLFGKHLSLFVRSSGQSRVREYEISIPHSELESWKQEIETAIRSHRGST